MNKTKLVQIRSTPKRHAEIMREARKLGLTTSAYVMMCIEHGHVGVAKQLGEKQ